MLATQPGRVNIPFETNLNVRQVPEEMRDTGKTVSEYFPISGEAVSGPSYTYNVSPDRTTKLAKLNFTALPLPEQNVTVKFSLFP